MSFFLLVLVLGADPVDPPADLQLKLLKRNDVMEELGVLEDQVNEVLRLPENDQEAEQAILQNRDDANPREAIKAVQAVRLNMAVKKMEKIQSILLPHQLRRLKELAWQYKLMYGTECLSDMGLKVSDETEKKIQQIAESRKGELVKYIKKFEEETQRMLLDELSDEDRQKLEKTLGKKFKFDSGSPDR